MARVKEWRPDVVFLDIEMNGTSGIELARELPPACCLVFTTAYAHYAPRRLRGRCCRDFPAKPYFYERFERAMQKAEEWLRMHDLLRIAESASRSLEFLESGITRTYRSLSIDSLHRIADNYVRNLHHEARPSAAENLPAPSRSSFRSGSYPNLPFVRRAREFVLL